MDVMIMRSRNQITPTSLAIRIVVIIAFATGLLSLKYLNTPNYESGFQRSKISIDDGLDAVEAVVADIPAQIATKDWPKNGYYLRIFKGNPPSQFIDRFKVYDIPKVRLGHIKHWGDDRQMAQIDVDLMRETGPSSMEISGRIRYTNIKAGGYETLFKYSLQSVEQRWLVIERVLFNREYQSD